MAKVFLGMGLMPVPLLLTPLVIGDTPSSSVWPWIVGSVAFGCMAAAGVVWMERRAIAQRVMIEVKPNRLIVDGVELDVPISSDTHLFKCRDSMDAMMSRVIEQIISRKSGWLVLRTSAELRVVPAPLFLTEIERDALEELLNREFIEPKMVVVGAG